MNKKLKKFLTKPVLFFKDSFINLNKIRKENEYLRSKLKIKEKDVVLNEVFISKDNANIIHLTDHTKIVQNKYKSNILLNLNLDFFIDNEYEGFDRQNNIIIKHEIDNFFIGDNIYDIFLKNNMFRGNYFSNFKNIIVRNPTNYLPILFKYTNPNFNLFVIIDKYDSFTDNFLNTYIEELDFIYIKEDVVKDYAIFNNKLEYIVYREKFELLRLLRNDSINQSKKRKEVLFPIIYDEVNTLNNIDIYNQDTYIDGVIKFTQKEKDKEINTFIDIIDNIKNIEILLLKENIKYKYETYINANNYIGLLKKSLKDGVRYDVL